MATCSDWTQDPLQKWCITTEDLPLYKQKNSGKFSRMRLQVYIDSGILLDSPGGEIQTIVISINTLHSCPAPVTALIFHANHSLEAGWPSVFSTHYLKPRHLPPTALSLLQLVTFARVLQTPTSQACCQMLVRD